MSAYNTRGAETQSQHGVDISAAWIWQVNVGGPMTRYKCGSNWVDFTDDLVRNLEAAYMHNERIVMYEFQNTQYRIDMEEAVQINMTTQTRRAVRRVFTSYPWPAAIIPETAAREHDPSTIRRSTSRSSRHQGRT